ncbi:hypothetical protein GETHLI_33610 [Geothrix limicola]|uniref:4-fold beta flower domain-containing protein n=1 Tax=Geothrix limicola TaxID=2927978 RepID=A0ABQ5QJ08_9BACT|nr:hypothetical protein GETHLI_33610 [Geothrix limicola]
MERVLYDSQDCPIAYIAEDGQRTICLWNGHAVAYIDDHLNCFGWNGRHLGWMEDGILFDTLGQAIGFMKSKHPSPSRAQPPKLSKIVRDAKHPKVQPFPRPLRKTGKGDRTLSELLRAGATDSDPSSAHGSAQDLPEPDRVFP